MSQNPKALGLRLPAERPSTFPSVPLYKLLKRAHNPSLSLIVKARFLDPYTSPEKEPF